MNSDYECMRDTIIRKCGSELYDAVLDSSGPIFEVQAPGCKLTAKKVTGDAPMFSISFIMLGIGLISAFLI